MEWLKETLIGIALIAICRELYLLYIGYSRLCNEDNNIGRRARKIGEIGSGLLWAYIAICSITGLIIGLISMFY